MEGIKNKAHAYMLELHQRLTVSMYIRWCSKRSVHTTQSAFMMFVCMNMTHTNVLSPSYATLLPCWPVNITHYKTFTHGGEMKILKYMGVPWHIHVMVKWQEVMQPQLPDL